MSIDGTINDLHSLLSPRGTRIQYNLLFSYHKHFIHFEPSNGVCSIKPSQKWEKKWSTISRKKSKLNYTNYLI